MAELVPSRTADPTGDLPSRDPETGLFPLSVRLAKLTAIIVPFLGVVAVPFLRWGQAFFWADLTLLLVMHILFAWGITVGFHRWFTHRSFETNIVVRFVLVVRGSMAVQGPLLKWVATHRRHHQHSDTVADPHSPFCRRSGGSGLLQGAWHSHIGWMFLIDDQSRNNWWFGCMALGEGWHHTHHAFPSSASHDLWWRQLDQLEHGLSTRMRPKRKEKVQLPTETTFMSDYKCW